jgi:hypothetical protein
MSFMASRDRVNLSFSKAKLSFRLRDPNGSGLCGVSP